MKSKESGIAMQARLNQWALDVQDCMNRPQDMTIVEWCEQHNIKKANYYWRLKRVRQACLEQVEQSARSFVELPATTECKMPLAPVQANTNDNASTVVVFHTSDGVSIEIKACASMEFVKNLIGAFANA